MAEYIPPELGDRLEYRGPIGAGGMGLVLRVFDRKLQRDAALKVLHSGLAEPDQQARFLRECRTLARVEHPGVVRVFDAGWGDTGGWLLMELLSGHSLEEEQDDGPGKPEAVADWLAKLLDALAAVHAAGLLHRDIKPSNVMLRHGEEPVLIDFGLARFLAGQTAITEAGALVGTPHFLAPELLRSEPYSAGTDVFATGCIAYGALAGEPLHAGARGDLGSVLRWLATHAYHAPMEQRMAPFGRLGDLVARMLDPDPGRRFRDAADAGRELAKLRESGLLTAPSPRTTPVATAASRASAPSPGPPGTPGTAATSKSPREHARAGFPSTGERPSDARHRRWIAPVLATGGLAAALIAAALLREHAPVSASVAATPLTSPSTAASFDFGAVLDALGRAEQAPGAAAEDLLRTRLLAYKGPARPPPSLTQARTYSRLARDAAARWLHDMDRVFASFGTWYSKWGYDATLNGKLLANMSRLDLRRHFVKDRLNIQAPADVARMRAEGRRLREQGQEHLRILLTEDVDFGVLGVTGQVLWSQVEEDEALCDDGTAAAAFLDRAFARHGDSWLAERLRAREHRLRARYSQSIEGLRRCATKLLDVAKRAGVRAGDEDQALTLHGVALELATAAADQPSRAAGVRALVDALDAALPVKIPGSGRLAAIDRDLEKVRVELPP